MRPWMTGFAALVSITALVIACGGDSDCDSDSCAGPAAGGDGGDAGGDVVGPPPGCDEKADPTMSPACVVDDYAVFVSSRGTADGAGTMKAPVNSVAAALVKRGKRPRIYICEGTYAEAVALTSAVTIVGGFDCQTWTYSGAAPKFDRRASASL